MSWLAEWDCFVKVVAEGSMAAAARRLDCSRAQVSKQIGELERRFGVRLFERSTRRLVLTPAGEVFHGHALQALQSVEGAEMAVRNVGTEVGGLLRISATVIFGRECIAPLIPRVLAQYPDLRCELLLSDARVDLGDGGIAARSNRMSPTSLNSPMRAPASSTVIALVYTALQSGCACKYANCRASLPGSQ